MLPCGFAFAKTQPKKNEAIIPYEVEYVPLNAFKMGLKVDRHHFLGG